MSEKIKKLRSRIASVTLAQLYLQQNHRDQAEKIVASLLAENPLNGHALVLKNRLNCEFSPNITAKIHGHGIRLNWRGAPVARFSHGLCIIVLMFARSAQKSMSVTSVPCHNSQGEWFLRSGKNPGAACVCMVVVNPDYGLTPIAVCEPLIWSPSINLT